jgi:aryl-alcohol dehydrogenase-like predicted oxidoreductase
MENEYLMIFKTVGMGTTIWSPLASGLLSGKYNNGIPKDSRFALKGFDWLKDQWMKKDIVDKVKKLKKLADEMKVSMAQLSIAWCINNPHVTTAILGATNKKQLLENLKSIDIIPKLNNEILEKLETIVKTKPVLPEY